MPRPSSKPTGALWALLDEWANAEAANSIVGHKPTQVEMARLFQVSDSLVSQWKFMETQVQMSEIARIAAVTGIGFADVAEAVQADMPTVERNVQRRADAARDRGKRGKVDQARAAQDRVADRADPEGPEFGA